MDWYTLSRKWFDFVFENPEKSTCTEWILYMWIIECWNRNWKSLKFWLPTFHSMGACWIKSPNTYHKALKNLISYWFIEIIQEAKNQNTSMVISLSAHLKNKSAHKSALDIALIQQLSQQEEHIKQVNKETNKQINKKILSDTINIISEAWSGFSIYLEYILNSNLDITDDIDIEKARLLHSKIIEYKQILNWNEERIFIEWKNMIDWYVDEKRQVKNIKRIITNWFSKKLK